MHTADLQCSDICITDGTFAWQTVGEHSSSSNEPSSLSASAEASAVVPLVDHSSNEAAILLPDDSVNDTQLTLVNIDFTIPKVNFIFSVKCRISC